MKIMSTCIVLSFVFTCHVSASPLPDFPFVTVTGEATQAVKPDQAQISFTIMTLDSVSEKASQRMVDTTENVINTLLTNGIAKDDLISYELDKQAERQRDEIADEYKIVAYRFEREVTFTVRDLQQYSTLTDFLLNTDYVHNLRSEFDVSKRQEIETQLIGKAAENAKAKAQVMATGLGVTIDSVFAFNDKGSFSSFFATFGLNENSYWEGISVSGSRISHEAFVPQSIEITKKVNVVYKISTKFF